MTIKETAEWLRDLLSKVESGALGEDICFDDIVQEAEGAFEDEL
jgi:hypothetical protein